MRLFGAESASFRLADKGLSVETEKGERYVILLESLVNPATFEQGTFFSRLLLKTDRGNKIFVGLSKKNGQRLFEWLRAHWLQTLAPDVSKTLESIRALINKGYPRQSRLEKIITLAKQSLAGFKVVPEPSWCRMWMSRLFSGWRRLLSGSRRLYVLSGFYDR